jgi:PAS domain S-box-containing protein
MDGVSTSSPVRARPGLVKYDPKTVDGEGDHLEARLRQLIALSPIASVITNPRLPDNPIVAVNQPFLDLTGYARDEVLGRNCRFLAGPETERSLSAEMGQGIAERRPVLVEILNYKKDGTPFRNAVMVAPLFGEDGQLAFFLGSQIEIPDDDAAAARDRRRRAADLVQRLSKRQWQVLKLAASGLLNKQIAAELGLSEKTVKMHRAILMERLETPTSAEMIRIAVEAGL